MAVSELSDRRVAVDVWSDVICPFCYIGETLLAQAVDQFAAGEVEVRFHSYQLMPDLPADAAVGLDELVAGRYGLSLAQAHGMNERVTRQAAQAGLDFRLDDAIATNTKSAHRLIHFATSRGRQHAMVERLYCAYFHDGLNIGDYSVLASLAAEAGLDGGAAREALDRGAFEDDFQDDVRQAREMKLTGVPFFVFDGRYALSGAQPVESFLQALETACSDVAASTP